jgi:hypothetical protein
MSTKEGQQKHSDSNTSHDHLLTELRKCWALNLKSNKCLNCITGERCYNVLDHI